MTTKLSMMTLAQEFLRLAGGGTIAVGTKALDDDRLQFFALGPSSRAVVVIDPGDLLTDLDTFSAQFLAPMARAMGPLDGLLTEPRDRLLDLGESVAIATLA